MRAKCNVLELGILLEDAMLYFCLVQTRRPKHREDATTGEQREMDWTASRTMVLCVSERHDPAAFQEARRGFFGTLSMLQWITRWSFLTEISLLPNHQRTPTENVLNVLQKSLAKTMQCPIGEEARNV